MTQLAAGRGTRRISGDLNTVSRVAHACFSGRRFVVGAAVLFDGLKLTTEPRFKLAQTLHAGFTLHAREPGESDAAPVERQFFRDVRAQCDWALGQELECRGRSDAGVIEQCYLRAVAALETPVDAKVVVDASKPPNRLMMLLRAQSSLSSFYSACNRHTELNAVLGAL